VASLSGGCCGAFADAAEAEGVQLAHLAPETIVAAGLPAGQLGNPLDLVSNAVGPEVTEQVLTQGLNALEEDRAVGAVVYADSILLPINEVADTLIQRHCERRKPLVVAWDLGSQGAQAFARLQQAGVPTFRSLRVAARWLQLTLRERPTLEIGASDPQLLAEVTAALDPTQEVSTEAELTPVLARLGIPMAESRLVRNSDAVGEATDVIGTPVAVKVISPQLLHRHAVGAVALNLKARGEAIVAAESFLAQYPMANARDGLLVQRMVEIGDEYFIGLHRDAHFGLLLLFGRGGVNVERDGKVVARRLPMTAGEIAAMVAEVDPDAPIAAISEVAYRLAELGQHLGDRLLSLEINPLVTPVHASDTVLGLDALATFAVPPQLDTTTSLTSINTTEDTYV
jgi:acyl-CoA synthetase (NDP forming)